MQAVADALSLLANLVMAWNTMKMESVLDRWNTPRSTAVPPGLQFSPRFRAQSTGTFSTEIKGTP
jgi:hypothetical protein